MQLAIKESLLFYSTSDKFQWIITNEPNILRCKLMLNFSILVKTETQAAISATVTEIFPILKQVICTLLLIFCFIFYIFLCKKLSIVDYQCKLNCNLVQIFLKIGNVQIKRMFTVLEKYVYSFFFYVTMIMVQV